MCVEFCFSWPALGEGGLRILCQPVVGQRWCKALWEKGCGLSGTGLFKVIVLGVFLCFFSLHSCSVLSEGYLYFNKL